MDSLTKYGLTGGFSNEATLYPHLQVARITAQYRGLYKIITMQSEMQSEISGKFRFETTELAKFPTVGDFVMISYNDEVSVAWDSGATPVVPRQWCS